MYCAQCGKELKEGVKFCTNCGAVIKIQNTESKSETTHLQTDGLKDTNAKIEEPKIKEPERNTVRLENVNAQYKEPIPKNKKHGGIIAAVVLLIIIAVIGVCSVGFWLLGGKNLVYDAIGNSFGLDMQLEEDGEAYINEKLEKEPEELKEREDEEKPIEIEEEVTESTPASTEEEEVQEESEYILENSNVEYLTKEDLEGLSAEQCRLARNELYARHGRLFDDEDLQNYFNSCSWYHGSIPGEDFDESMLSDIEIANRDLIVDFEKEMGYR